MSTIQCQAFTKQASHQTYLQSQKCFHICSTPKKNAAVNHLSILSPNCLLAVQTWSTNWRGGEEDRPLHLLLLAAPQPTLNTNTNIANNNTNTVGSSNLVHQLKDRPTQFHLPAAPMITRLPAGLAQQLPALVQRTTCLLMCHWDY